MRLLIWALIGILGLFAASNTLAYTDHQAIEAIIGECEGEGYKGMYAVACAIRNRGNLHGVYGANSLRVLKANGKLWQAASHAWAASEEGYDVTYGATHWESSDFRQPRWAENMKHTVKIGRHRFYVEA